MSLRSRSYWMAMWCWTSNAWTGFYLNGYVPFFRPAGQVVASCTAIWG